MGRLCVLRLPHLLPLLGIQGEGGGVVVQRILNPGFGNLEVVRVQFDADVVEATPNRTQPTGATAHKWVEDRFTGVCDKKREVPKERGGLGARVMVLLHRLFHERAFALVPFDHLALREVLHPQAALGRRRLVVFEDGGCHLDRAVAKRVLDAQAAIAIGLPMSLHRLRGNRLHYKDDILVGRLHSGMVGFADPLASRCAVRILPSEATTKNEPNLFELNGEAVRGPGRSEGDQAAAGFQHPEALFPDGNVWKGAIPIDARIVDVIRRIANDRRDAVGQDRLQAQGAVAV